MIIPRIKKLNLELSTSRIETLTDGIFAIAMTLLVLNLDITPMGKDTTSTSDQVAKDLMGIWPHMFHYIQSFIILAIFWIKHHQQFHFIKRSDDGLLKLNILCLMSICLIPFSTSLVGDYGNFLPAALAFEVNMLVTGVLYYLHWVYVTRKHRLVDENLDPEIVRAMKHTSLVLPVFAVASIGISLIYPRPGTYIYFLIPLALRYIRR